ncbi:HPr family phosphocarrier protein [Dactylosporangium sp. NPDC051485]|uniref:HPr family phosphocarrier protein n=1 Tax=Dactylosporangium sp. NPDC051485 TaxID=3154846 RepID=UPI0034458F2F
MPTRTVIVGSASACTPAPPPCFAAAAKQPVAVTISTDNGRKPVPARSMLGVLSLGAKQGTAVTLEASGEGAQAALDELAALLARDLAALSPDAPSLDASDA